MKKLIFSLIVVLMLTGFAWASIPGAGEISIGDHSFENQSMIGGSYNYIESPWFTNDSCWASIEGVYGVSNVPDGTQYATPSDDDLYQDLSATYEEGVGLTLTALASSRGTTASGADDAWEIALHDTSGTVLASTRGNDPCNPSAFDLVQGQWDQISVQYTPTTTDDGKAIRIYFSTGLGLNSANWKFVLDDVHLVKDCDPIGTTGAVDPCWLVV